jgi:hypothetical protein
MKKLDNRTLLEREANMDLVENPIYPTGSRVRSVDGWEGTVQGSRKDMGPNSVIVLIDTGKDGKILQIPYKAMWFETDIIPQTLLEKQSNLFEREAIVEIKSEVAGVR